MSGCFVCEEQDREQKNPMRWLKHTKCVLAGGWESWNRKQVKRKTKKRSQSSSMAAWLQCQITQTLRKTSQPNASQFCFCWPVLLPSSSEVITSIFVENHTSFSAQCVVFISWQNAAIYKQQSRWKIL